MATPAQRPDATTETIGRSRRADDCSPWAPSLLCRRRMTLTTERGFTFIEVLVVTVVIGVLAGIAIPHYTDMKARGLDSQVVAVVRHVATGEEAYFATQLRYTDAIDELDGIVTGGIAITVASGNSGDLASSFRVHGTVGGAMHAYEWVSDPPPGESHLVEE